MVSGRGRQLTVANPTYHDRLSLQSRIILNTVCYVLIHTTFGESRKHLVLSGGYNDYCRCCNQFEVIAATTQNARQVLKDQDTRPHDVCDPLNGYKFTTQLNMIEPSVAQPPNEHNG